MNNEANKNETNEATGSKENWPRLYVIVIAILVLQIAVYAWISSQLS